MEINPEIVNIMRCPASGEKLHQNGKTLVNEAGTESYRITETGIPLFAERFCSSEGKIQQDHYDRVASAYIENLTYPHTIAYMEYLDDAFLRHVNNLDLKRVAEI